MKVKYLAHASFKITAQDGTILITDPYQTGEKLMNADINERADIVTISHEHFDHNNPSAVKGSPEVIKSSAPVEVKGVRISGLDTFHDTEKGTKRGKNIIFCIEMEGIKLCHMGDLGHELNAADLVRLGKVDVLFVPVGGFYTIDAATAVKMVDAIKPKVVIPMHFKTPRCEYPITPVDDFVRELGRGVKKNTRRGGSEAELHKDKLPAATEAIIMDPSL